MLFFFFKQKTAYEMRISDWSSDVCSSDLCPRPSAATRWRWHEREADAGAAPRSWRRGAQDGDGDGGRARQTDAAADRDPAQTAGRGRGAAVDRSCLRSEERSVGEKCVSTGRSRWSRYT